MKHNLSECGKAHCWGCDKHILLREMPYCEGCKK